MEERTIHPLSLLYSVSKSWDDFPASFTKCTNFKTEFFFFFSDSEESAAIRLSTIHVGSNNKRASGSQPFTGGIHPSAADFLSSGGLTVGLRVGKVMGRVRGYLSWRCVVRNSRAE